MEQSAQPTQPVPQMGRCRPELEELPLGVRYCCEPCGWFGARMGTLAEAEQARNAHLHGN